MINYPIIKSLLDNDFYKFTMQNAIIKLFPTALVKYKFINRGNHIFPMGFNNELKNCINHMSNLKLSYNEKKFLKNKFSYLDNSYLSFLENYRFDPNEIKISEKKGIITLYIEGLWYRTILWEIPLMAIISELYYKFNNNKIISYNKLLLSNKYKIKKYKKLKIFIAEFGTRRRYSYEFHNSIIKILKKEIPNYFLGTSNVHLSNILNINTIGTHGHEWYMFHGAKYGFKLANILALKNWLSIYNNNLKIALADTYTNKNFFKIFNKKLANIFDGIRHDSGDPILFTKQLIEHYNKLNINYHNKMIIFSDNLNFNKINNIINFCKNKMKIYFGIGNDLTNNIGINKINIVIKMIKYFSKKKGWIDVIKISNVKEKHSGNPKIIQLAKKILNI